MTEVQAPRLRDQDLAGKVAVITGASRGIGRAIALQLASRGCSILGTCSGPDSLVLIDSLSHTVSSLYSGKPSAPKVTGVVANITQSDCVDAIVRGLDQKFDGRIDILVINAVHVELAVQGQMEPNQVSSMLFANVQVPVMLVNELVKRKLFQTSSRIVGISSSAARMSMPDMPGRSMYTAVKSALEGLARAWSDELGANPALEFMKGTTANAVSVGFTDTELSAKMTTEVRHASLSRQSLGERAALPEDIADAVGFLCGPDSRWVTGSVLSADGGFVKMV